MNYEGARLLLDTQAITPLFRRLPALQGRPVGGSELVALWVKPGRHFNACYRLDVGGTGTPTVLASAFALGTTSAAQIRSNIGAHVPDVGSPAACAHCSALLTEPGLLLQLFPFDYRLPTLSACLDAPRISRTLDSVPPLIDCEPAGYRPGMRCQIRYRTAAGTSVYGKVAVERQPAQTFHVHQRVHAKLRHSTWRFEVPEPLRYIPELHLALVAEARADSLYDVLRSKRCGDADIQRVAAALADFHRLDLDGVERVYAVQDEIDLVAAWVSLIAVLFPPLAASLHECHAELVRTQPDPREATVFVHRDFYDKQVLLSSNRLTLLDMDTACRGDPEVDLGNFSAQLYLRGLQWDLAMRCAQLERVFVAGYPGTVACDRVGWYRRSSLLRLACGYALRPRWGHLAPMLLEEFLRQ